MSETKDITGLASALPFWLSLVMIPLALAGAVHGGWTVFLLPVYGWIVTSILDAIAGLNHANGDTETPEDGLFWYRFLTIIWFPVQAGTLYGLIWYVTQADHLGTWEKAVLFFGVGVITGSVGITYAHELMHQKNRLERWLGDLLLATVLYSHFRTEHLLVHHRYVGTPRDAVTARYNEGFPRMFLRVLTEGPASAWRAERQMLARAGRGPLHRSNPFWRYGVLQLVALALAFAIGGWAGLALFLWQALVAIWQLELVNYVEHYGLTRRHLGEGRYEHVLPRHSWNADHRVTNWLLINLQRHSDHHYKPDRRFPLLQTYDPDEAPQLPLGYPAMTALAMIPPLWRRRMNPRVREWRRRHYPDIADWTDYNRGRLPMPKGAS
ncbi:MAG: alkane 1-monooxygenase [Rhodobacteraceae bacterium]|jgi:alkane 1-monooxygenase|uniref:alkane 1-monooxygenase n=1 Tax=Albidovulum sp. TaxID=1872424 RepID=UPI001D5D679A|nr:alkane 1-monooxygenase [uncultured Defluviimonas sp.]MCB2124194.1 alkane 1-monooxygenase [Paracoccaceae bacterium]MCC0070979.1 alkane 1-monooxygenase [Paracoccaceae bacterium]